jgi:hypothetical protein
LKLLGEADGEEPLDDGMEDTPLVEPAVLVTEAEVLGE